MCKFCQTWKFFLDDNQVLWTNSAGFHVPWVPCWHCSAWPLPVDMGLEVGQTVSISKHVAYLLNIHTNNVANSWQNFPASPAEKFSHREKPLLKLTFCRYLGWWKLCYLSLHALEKWNISLNCTELETTRGEQLIFNKFGPFCRKSAKIRQQLCLADLLFNRLSYHMGAMYLVLILWRRSCVGPQSVSDSFYIFYCVNWLSLTQSPLIQKDIKGTKTKGLC